MKLTGIKGIKLNQLAKNYRSLVLVLVISSLLLGGCGGSGGDSGTVAVSAVVPTAPQALSALCVDLEATVSWSEPEFDGGSSVTGYNIYRGIASSNLSLLTNVDSIDRCFVDETAENGVEYFYAVAAMNEVGQGDLSEEASVTVVTPPEAPVNLTGSREACDIDLSWTTPINPGTSAITSYNLYKGPTGGTLVFWRSYTTTYTDIVCTGDETHILDFAVSAVNENGEGALSERYTLNP